MRGRVRYGQSLVEFALVAPLFFALVFAVIDAGRAVVTLNLLSNVARDGARYASVAEVNQTTGLCTSVTSNRDSAIRSAAMQSAGPFANDIDVIETAICGQDATSPNYPRYFYTVQASIQFQPFTSLVVGFGPMNLTSSSTIYLYQP